MNVMNNASYFDISTFKKQPPEAFYKKTALKHFAIFTGKYLCWSLFLIKLQALKPPTLLKRDCNIGVAVNIAKFLRTPILKNICERLPQACNVIKKETLAQVFSCEFCRILKNTFFIKHIWATASVFVSK